MQARILIVVDDPHIRKLLSEFLDGYGFSCKLAADGGEMGRVMAHSEIDVIILDLMLPGENGLSLCRQLRADSQIPIIMVTARGELSDRIVGLELGADDYVVKPFEPRELVARINTILRRTRTAAPASNVSPQKKGRGAL